MKAADTRAKLSLCLSAAYGQGSAHPLALRALSAERTASSTMADKEQDVWIKVPSRHPLAMPGPGLW